MSASADKRRFNGPESARPIQYNPSSSKLSLLDSNSLRNDGRTSDGVRPIFLKTGLVANADGSAYIETGKTKLIVAVYGPKPTPPSAAFNPKARLNVEIKLAPFASGVRRFTPGKDTESASLALTLYQSLLPSLILDALPKSQIDLFVTILESDGSEADISAGVTAASVALASAGVQMYGLVTSSHLVLHADESGTLIQFLDPTAVESKSATCFASLACIPAVGTVTNLVVNGSIALEKYTEVLETLFKSCGQIHAVSKQALLEDYSSEK